MNERSLGKSRASEAIPVPLRLRLNRWVVARRYADLLDAV